MSAGTAGAAYCRGHASGGRLEPVEAHGLSRSCGGEDGIRTRGRGLSPYGGLANRWFQPLTHLSVNGQER
jgi:hypothetical protein